MNTSYLKNPVFYISAIVITVLALLGAIFPEQFGRVVEALFLFTTDNFGWFYLLAVLLIIAFLVVLAISKYGKIRLGGEDERPEYNFFTWVGMLFSAGFGVGLVFWGVAEPMSHYFSTPFANLESQSEEAARVAMGYSFFHWGISQWAIFAIVGLVIGFMRYRKEENSLISSAIEPVIGSRQGFKNTIDILAVIATVMGVATSLGLGVLQVNGGLGSVTALPSSTWLQLVIIAVLFIAYTLSSMTGLDKGIKYLSNVNLGLCLVLFLFVFIVGPTAFILSTFTLGMGDYLANFIQYSLRLTPYVGDTWVRDWTIFYWAWAIAWSPFVGAFIARVSKGRTIRQFVFGVMVVPPLIACLWIAAFGGTALYKDLNEGAGIAEIVDTDISVALFEVFNTLPLSGVVSFLSILLIFTFLITSADSAAYILGTMTSKGKSAPPLYMKIIWGVLIAAIAAVLLVSGGLDALQTASLVSALPFTIIVLIMMVALLMMLKKEPLPVSKQDLRRYKKLEERAEQHDNDKS